MSDDEPGEDEKDAGGRGPACRPARIDPASQLHSLERLAKTLAASFSTGFPGPFPRIAETLRPTTGPPLWLAFARTVCTLVEPLTETDSKRKSRLREARAQAIQRILGAANSDVKADVAAAAAAQTISAFDACLKTLKLSPEGHWTTTYGSLPPGGLRSLVALAERVKSVCELDSDLRAAAAVAPRHRRWRDAAGGRGVSGVADPDSGAASSKKKKKKKKGGKMGPGGGGGYEIVEIPSDALGEGTDSKSLRRIFICDDGTIGNVLLIDRGRFLESSINELLKIPAEQVLRRGLKIVYTRNGRVEEGSDEGGLLKDWVQSTADILFNPELGLVVQNTFTRVTEGLLSDGVRRGFQYVRLSETPEAVDMPNKAHILRAYRCMGRLLALALDYKFSLGVRLAPPFAKMIIPDDDQDRTTDVEGFQPSDLAYVSDSTFYFYSKCVDESLDAKQREELIRKYFKDIDFATASRAHMLAMEVQNMMGQISTNRPSEREPDAKMLGPAPSERGPSSSEKQPRDKTKLLFNLNTRRRKQDEKKGSPRSETAAGTETVSESPPMKRPRAARCLSSLFPTETTPGEHLAVTPTNLNQYVMLTINKRLRVNVQEQADEVHRGLSECYPIPVSSRVLVDAIAGHDAGFVDVAQWRARTVVLEAETTKRWEVLDWFWRHAFELDARGRSQLLYWVTGLRALPRPTQCAQSVMSIRLVPTSEDGRLPTAHTCSCQLDLPEYSTAEVLVERVNRAVRHTNFGVL